MEQYHPIVSVIYLGFVIGCSMVFMHPLCLCISLSGAVCYTIWLFERKRAKKGFAGVFVLMVLTAVINPTFSHQGVTALATFPSGNVLTLESVYFGMGAAGMLGATLLWFHILSEIITTDKIVYLFGKTFPILGMILSMVLGFIPKLKRKLAEIELGRRQDLAQKERQLEQDLKKKWKRYKIRFFHSLENLSILVTWTLEDAVEMGDSMKGRGYGLPGRTAYTIYRFTGRDVKMLLFFIAMAGYILLGNHFGAMEWAYYPITEGAEFTPYTVSVYFVYVLLCMGPVTGEWGKERRWKKLQSDI